jgi:TfoX/Sxy family transcriptional regulator of competence genes
MIKMMNAEERFAEIVAVYEEDTAVTPAKMFGATGLKVNGKVFALLVKGELVVKLPKEQVDTLVAGGLGINFDPGHGRLMKEWLTVPQIFQDDWPELASEAYRFLTQ